MAGLYVHIPYCIKKCDYCDFISFPENGGLNDYVPALLREIELTAAQEEMPTRFDTVFFGGGTPSLLQGGQLCAILETLQKCFTIEPDAECTVECNPGTVSPDKLSAYRTAGVNRLSFGMQSHNDELLRSIGRIHTYSQFVDSVRYAQDAGFANINADVMHGLPNQTCSDYLDSLRAAIAAGVTHISSYALILEEHTPLYARVRRGETTLPGVDATADMEDAGFALLRDVGFERYEISNFARPGFPCRHNVNYWQNGEYLGFGLAAHSAARLGAWTRWSNLENVTEYMRAIGKGRRPIAEKIRLYQRDEMFECVMLGTRLAAGIDRAAFAERFGIDVLAAYPDAFSALKDKGWLRVTDRAAALTDAGLDMQNAALQYFLR